MTDRIRTMLAEGRTAIILCEVQEGVLGDAAPWPQLRDAAVAVNLIDNVKGLISCARDHGAPVIHCTAEFLPARFGANTNGKIFGSAKKRVESDQSLFARPVAGTFAQGDILLPRLHGLSPMTGSSLDSVLRNEGIETLVITGVSVSFAVTNLTMDAVNRAYQVILPRDAVAGFPAAYADTVIDNTLSMLASVAETREIIAAWSEA